jgi:hypothetical protein
MGDNKLLRLKKRCLPDKTNNPILLGFNREILGNKQRSDLQSVLAVLSC